MNKVGSRKQLCGTGATSDKIGKPRNTFDSMGDMNDATEHQHSVPYAGTVATQLHRSVRNRLKRKEFLVRLQISFSLGIVLKEANDGF